MKRSMISIFVLVGYAILSAQCIDITYPVSAFFPSPMWILSREQIEDVNATGVVLFADSIEDLLLDLSGKIVFVTHTAEYGETGAFVQDNVALFHQCNAEGIVIRDYDFNVTGRLSVLHYYWAEEYDWAEAPPLFYMSGFNADAVKDLTEEHAVVEGMIGDEPNPWIYEGVWIVQLFLGTLFGSVALLSLYRIFSFLLRGGSINFALNVVIMPTIFIANIIRLITVIIDPYFRNGNMSPPVMITMIVCTWPFSLLVILLIGLYWQELLKKKAEANSFIVKYRKGYTIFSGAYIFFLCSFVLTMIIFSQNYELLSGLYMVFLLTMMLSVLLIALFFLINSIRILLELSKYKKTNKASIIATYFILTSTTGSFLFIIGSTFGLLDLFANSGTIVFHALSGPLQLGGLTITDMFLCFAFAERMKSSRSTGKESTHKTKRAK